MTIEEKQSLTPSKWWKMITNDFIPSIMNYIALIFLLTLSNFNLSKNHSIFHNSLPIIKPLYCFRAYIHYTQTQTVLYCSSYVWKMMKYNYFQHFRDPNSFEGPVMFPSGDRFFEHLAYITIENFYFPVWALSISQFTLTKGWLCPAFPVNKWSFQLLRYLDFQVRY